VQLNNKPDALTITPVNDRADTIRGKPDTREESCTIKSLPDCMSQVAGPHVVTASLRGYPDVAATLEVKPGPTTQLEVTPQADEIGFGQTAGPYKVIGFDKYDNETDEVFAGETLDGAATHLRMVPNDAPCSTVASTCTPKSIWDYKIFVDRDGGA